MMWVLCTVLACMVGTWIVHRWRPPERRTEVLDERWQARVRQELGLDPVDPVDPGELFSPHGYMLAAAMAGEPPAARRVLLQAGDGMPEAALRTLAVRRWPGASVEAVGSWSEAGGGYHAMVIHVPSYVPVTPNWQCAVDHLALHGYRHLLDGGTLLLAVSSVVDLPQAVAQFRRNGYDVTVLRQQLFRWREAYYDDVDYVALANRLRCFEYDNKHRRLETISVLRATLRPTLRSCPPDGRPPPGPDLEPVVGAGGLR